MKKLIVVIIASLILTPIMADAQIQVQKHHSSETIKSLRMGYVQLDRTVNTYFLTMKSDNQFDDFYVVKLGNEPETAIKSLNSLIEVSSAITKNESVVFNDGFKEYRIYRGLMKSEIWLKADGYAGYAKTSTMELNKLLKALKNSK